MYNSFGNMSDSISQRDGIGQGTVQAGRYLWVVLLLVTGAVSTKPDAAGSPCFVSVYPE